MPLLTTLLFNPVQRFGLQLFAILLGCLFPIHTPRNYCCQLMAVAGGTRVPAHRSFRGSVRRQVCTASTCTLHGMAGSSPLAQGDVALLGVPNNWRCGAVKIQRDLHFCAVHSKSFMLKKLVALVCEFWNFPQIDLHVSFGQCSSFFSSRKS